MLFSQNFMLQDWASGFVAFLLFPLFLLLPGYFAARLLDLFSFRERHASDRLGISVCVSIGITPPLLYLTEHFLGIAAAWVLMAVFWLGAIFFAIRDGGWRIGRLLVAVVALAIFLIFTVSDFQWHGTLALSIAAGDWGKHIAITDAIFRTGADPANPFFRPGHDIGLFYYYFWFLICAWVERVGAPIVDARAAVLGCVPWAAIALLATVRLYAQFFFPENAARASRIAMALLLVSGLDIIPALIYAVLHFTSLHSPILYHIEWWNVQVTNWIASIVWVPHHIAALAAGLTGVLILRAGYHRPAHLLLAGMCFASAFGASVWVAAPIALGMGVWIAICSVEKRSVEARAFLFAGVLAAFAAAPFALHLNAVTQVHAMPVAPFVREFGPLRSWMEGTSPFVQGLVYLAALPLNYFFEFGFYAVAGLCFWRSKRKWDSNMKFALAFTAASVLLVTFVKSVMGSNDLGFRGVLVAQFFLIFCGAAVLTQAQAKTPTLLLVCAFLGVCTTAYDWTATRFCGLLTRTPERTRRFETRAAYRFVHQQLPVTAIVQHNPDTLNDVDYGLYGERQVAASDWFYGPLYTIEPLSYRSVNDKLTPLFYPGAGDQAIAAAEDELGIAALVVTSADPVWRDPKSWIWRRRPDFALDGVRVFLK